MLDGCRGIMEGGKRPRSIQIELGSDSKPRIMETMDSLGYLLVEKHWSQAGLDHIAKGNDPESYPHYGIFSPRP